MNELTNLLKLYPEVGAIVIAVVSGSIGWISRNIFQIIIDYIKYKKELKTFFWKEKINAAKKATEYYYEYLRFLNLVFHQFELHENKKIENKELFDSIKREVEFYSNKLKAFPHFEHHHINIFYDFDDTKIAEINTKILDIEQKAFENLNKDLNSCDENLEIKNLIKKQKENYSQLFFIIKDYVKIVRNDIEKYI